MRIRIWLGKLKEEQKQRVEAVCRDISKKDPTFRYSIEDDFLLVASENKDQAHKRGLLLCKKYFKDFDLGYNIEYYKT